MRNKKKKGSAVRRSLIKFRRSRAAEVLSVAILAIGLLVIIAVPTVQNRGEDVQEENNEETVEDPKPLVIEIPEKCTTGIVTVCSGDQKLYEYSGKIIIGNDGSNGEPVEVMIEYPEGTWPCSCFAE